MGNLIEALNKLRRQENEEQDSFNQDVVEQKEEIEESLLDIYKREIAKLVALDMQKIIYDVAEEECEGCRENEPGPKWHDVCLLRTEKKIDYCFTKLMDKIDLGRLNNETRHDDSLFLTKEELLRMAIG